MERSLWLPVCLSVCLLCVCVCVVQWADMSEEQRVQILDGFE